MEHGELAGRRKLILSVVGSLAMVVAVLAFIGMGDPGGQASEEQPPCPDGLRPGQTLVFASPEVEGEVAEHLLDMQADGRIDGLTIDDPLFGVRTILVATSGDGEDVALAAQLTARVPGIRTIAGSTCRR